MKILLLIISTTLITIICGSAGAQQVTGINLGSGYSLMPSVNYVSSASIQLYASSRDLFIKNITEELSGGYGYSFSVRKKLFSEDLSFGFTIEYLNLKDDELVQTFEAGNTRIRARVTEELWMMPMEFTGYFNVPKFLDDMNIYLGGGLGLYFGDRKRTIGSYETKTIKKEPGFSFVILSGMELLMTNNFSAVFEVRFRQGEYKVQSEFPSSTLIINGASFPVEKNLNSRIFVDGLKLSLGISYNF